ncbi:MAG: hypothetical protein HY288_11180 [Planctomycetia bacterium]|nr:hypothetical protein [Planctomycetia bacterium]
MFARCLLFCTAVMGLVEVAQAQGRRDTQALAPTPTAPSTRDDASASPAAAAGAPKWREANAANRTNPDASAPADSPPPLRAVSSGPPRQPIARVTKVDGPLANDAMAEWRDYDISPYTARVTSTIRPEQAILDWVLRETGYEAWHTQPSALYADHRTLHVFHTLAMHAVVSEMVDRFVNTEAESQTFGMRVISIASPDWRAKSHRMLHPVTAQTPGVQAWLLAKEDAALLVADLRRRSDFKEHSTPHLLVNNGQSAQIAATRPRNYVRDAILKPEGWPGFEPQMGQFDEGFKLEFSPLLSVDGKVVDAIIRCEVDQVEKMVPVMIYVPTAAVPKQRTKIEVPQLINSRLHERFRWPTEQVLLISLGVVPTPVPAAPGALGVNVPLISPATRADLLVFVESKGRLAGQPAALTPGQPQANTYRGRY